MKLYLILLISFSSLALANSAFYVLGENYILFSKQGESPIILSDIEPKSWALDRDRCRLWVTTQADTQLFQFDSGKKTAETPFLGRIVSDFRLNKFVTVEGSKKIHIRNDTGEVLKEIESSDVANLKRWVFLSNDESLALFQSESSKTGDSLWLARLNVEGTEVQRSLVEGSGGLWGNADFFVDEKNNQVWVGYARNTPEHTYSPFVKSFSLSGIKERSFHWNERGLFFDGCLNGRGDFLMVRDIPTMPYTVPVYSFFEKFSSKENPERVLEFDMNLLVDSIACESEAIYFAVHSILGGEARQIMVWSENKKKMPEPILTLPSRSQKIFFCK
jgi:hypothetical protein